MRYIIYGKNLEVTEGLKQAVHDKFSKLEKFFTPETEVQVTLSVQKDRSYDSYEGNYFKSRT